MVGATLMQLNRPGLSNNIRTLQRGLCCVHWVCGAFNQHVFFAKKTATRDQLKQWTLNVWSEHTVLLKSCLQCLQVTILVPTNVLPVFVCAIVALLLCWAGLVYTDFPLPKSLSPNQWDPPPLEMDMGGDPPPPP